MSLSEKDLRRGISRRVRAFSQEVLGLPVATAEEIEESFRRKIEERCADVWEKQTGYRSGIGLFELNGAPDTDVYVYNEGDLTRKQAKADLVCKVAKDVMNSYGIKTNRGQEKKPFSSSSGIWYATQFPTNTEGLFFIRTLFSDGVRSRVHWGVEAVKRGVAEATTNSHGNFLSSLAERIFP